VKYSRGALFGPNKYRYTRFEEKVHIDQEMSLSPKPERCKLSKREKSVKKLLAACVVLGRDVW
jgi:hypothetical protein